MHTVRSSPIAAIAAAWRRQLPANSSAIGASSSAAANACVEAQYAEGDGDGGERERESGGRRGEELKGNKKCLSLGDDNSKMELASLAI